MYRRPPHIQTSSYVRNRKSFDPQIARHYNSLGLATVATTRPRMVDCHAECTAGGGEARPAVVLARSRPASTVVLGAAFPWGKGGVLTRRPHQNADVVCCEFATCGQLLDDEPSDESGRVVRFIIEQFHESVVQRRFQPSHYRHHFHLAPSRS